MRRIPLGGDRLTKKQLATLQELIRTAGDMVFDLTHYECLCNRARRLDQPVWLVLMAILEKVFEGEIPPGRAMTDRPLTEVRYLLERTRLQPGKQAILEERNLALIEMVMATFPEEAPDPADQLFFTNFLRRTTRIPTTPGIEDLEDLAKNINKKGKRRTKVL